MSTALQNVARERQDFLVFGSPLIGEDEIAEVVATLRSGWIGTGPRVARFEQMMAEYAGTRYAIAVNSCTAALHLSLLAIGVGPGDEVITTPMTFAATANAIVHTGATPVFVDIEPERMQIDASRLESAITPRTKVILPVHFAGAAAPMDEIMAIAGKHGLRVIEDAAHCIEGTYRGRKVGSISDLTCFSFYVNKNLTTAEGGMVTTNNEEWAEHIRVLSLHGMDRDAYKRFSASGYKHYQVVAPGFKYNMTDIQAALGIHQLQRLESSWERRNQIWKHYQQCFGDLPLHRPAADLEDVRHARHLYTVLIDETECGKSRDAVMRELHERKIGTGVHYTALHLHPFYRQRFGFTEGMFPHAEAVGRSTLSLPLSAKLNDEDVEDVTNALRSVMSS